MYSELLELAAERQDAASLECLALNRLATLAAQVDLNQSAALELLQRAKSPAAGGSSIDQAETQCNLAQTQYYACDLPAARDHAERSLAAARQVGQPDLLGRCLNTTAYVLLDLGFVARALECIDDAYDLFVRMRNRAMQVDSLCARSGVLVALGRHADAVASAREALRISDDIDNPWGQVFSRYHLALALAEAGQLDDGVQLLRDAVARGASASSPFVWRLCHVALGSLQPTRGENEAVLATHLACTPHQAPDALAINPLDWLAVADLCADYAALGGWTEAARWAFIALQPGARIPAYARMRIIWYEVDALVHAGRRDAAQRTLETFLEVSGDSGAVSHRPTAGGGCSHLSGTPRGGARADARRPRARPRLSWKKVDRISVLS